MFTSTKGGDRGLTIPTLATVSLLINRVSFDILDQHSQSTDGYPPDPNEINGYIAAERLLEPLSEGVVAGLIELVCKGNLLHIIFGEQANLHNQPSSHQGQIGCRVDHTLYNIPASARAV